MTELKINKNALDFTHENFEYPCAQDIKSLRQSLGLNRGELALMVGVYADDTGGNSPTVRAWESEASRKRKIPLSAWIIMLTLAGLHTLTIDKTCKDKLIIE